MEGSTSNRIVRRIIIGFAVSIMMAFWTSPVDAETAVFKLKSGGPVLSGLAKIGDKISSHEAVINKLRDSATSMQADFLSEIEGLKSIGKVESYKQFWIINAISITADSGVINDLKKRNDVESVFEDIPIDLVAPVDSGQAMLADVGPQNGIKAIKAPEAWALGLDGRGSLVCNFDTGVNGLHAALMSKYRGNNGGAAQACWFDPYSDTSYPTDSSGHGTHTMGIMVGSEGADTVGVAPGAQWIAAAVVDRGGGILRSISDILAAFQWAADPDGDPSTTDDMPDVVNNSWGIPIGYYPACDQTFWEAIDNLEAAGVVCLFAAGNEGPNPMTIRTPADRIASDFNSFSVGAVDGNDPNLPVASFSSRGPSGCDGVTVKPEITAPGVAIRSTSRSGGYVVMSGTSMATPHVAGAVAILRQFNPHATPSEIKHALMLSATDLGQSGEDTDYGWGVIDIRRALYFMPSPDNPFLAFVGLNIPGDGIIHPGENISIGVTFENMGSIMQNGVAHLTTNDPRVTIISNDLPFASLDDHDTLALSSWDIQFSDNIAPSETIPFGLELESSNWNGRIVFAITIGDEGTQDVNSNHGQRMSIEFSNFPNPFNSQTLIKVSGLSNGNNLIDIFDLTGRLVKSISTYGNASIIWDGTDYNNAQASTGIYFAKLRSNSSTVRKMILLR
jgi:hypothetical protein